MKYNRLSSLLLSVILLVIGTVPAGISSEAAAQTPMLTQRLQSDLQSNAPMRRHLALLDINAIAHCPGTCTVALHSLDGEKHQFFRHTETSTGEMMDLTTLVPDLVRSYRRGPEDGQRLLALNALIGIGDEDALATLIEEGRNQSATVNQVTQKGIAEFYLTMYPELSAKAKWTGTISLDDVERTKRIRVKKAKKAENG